MKIGYIRISTADQNIARQEVLMRELGVENMFIDRMSASKNYQKEKYRDDSALKYYMNGRDAHVLHDDTRALLELLLEMLAQKGEEATNHFIRTQILSHKTPYEKNTLLTLKEQLKKES